jgi:hypothetical protein
MPFVAGVIVFLAGVGYIVRQTLPFGHHIRDILDDVFDLFVGTLSFGVLAAGVALVLIWLGC